MSQHSPDDGAMARLEYEMSRPATTTQRNGSHIGAEGLLLAPETVLHSLTPPLSPQNVSATDAAVFKAVASFRPFISHRRVSQTNPYPEQVQDGMGALLCADKSFVEIRQTR